MGAKAGVEKELEGARAELATLRTELEGERKASAGSGETLSQARLEVASLTKSLEEERSSRQAAADGLAAAQERVKGLEQALVKAQEVTTAELDRLRSELKTARGESEALKARLAGVESAEEQKETRIADLDRQLKEALAQQVEELSQYRSEFFGRLRQLLGDRQDIRVVGDRFVFQSELLFASGSATLDPEGTAALRELAQSLREVAGSIPSDLDWVLRVDGHTDRLPIRVGPFVSNWELSAARAISVVEFLIREGIPPDRLAAAGFGEFRPLDTRDDEIAYRRNRRIEFKLTEG
jgi:chemotaxis protein MotB